MSTEYHDPTPSALRVFLAESMGWRFSPPCATSDKLTSTHCWVHPGYERWQTEELPALTLDWLHECIRELLTDDVQWCAFDYELDRLTHPWIAKTYGEKVKARFLLTAEQTAVALYRTLAGKEGA